MSAVNAAISISLIGKITQIAQFVFHGHSIRVHFATRSGEMWHKSNAAGPVSLLRSHALQLGASPGPWATEDGLGMHRAASAFQCNWLPQEVTRVGKEVTGPLVTRASENTGAFFLHVLVGELGALAVSCLPPLPPSLFTQLQTNALTMHWAAEECPQRSCLLRSSGCDLIWK